jgi:hypothetical protein
MVKWIEFVKEYRDKNPKLSYKEAMVEAKTPYKKANKTIESSDASKNIKVRKKAIKIGAIKQQENKDNIINEIRNIENSISKLVDTKKNIILKKKASDYYKKVINKGISVNMMNKTLTILNNKYNEMKLLEDNDKKNLKTEAELITQFKEVRKVLNAKFKSLNMNNNDDLLMLKNEYDTLEKIYNDLQFKYNYKNQLFKNYLNKKQKELNKKINPSINITEEEGGSLYNLYGGDENDDLKKHLERHYGSIGEINSIEPDWKRGYVSFKIKHQNINTNIDKRILEKNDIWKKEQKRIEIEKEKLKALDNEKKNNNPREYFKKDIEELENRIKNKKTEKKEYEKEIEDTENDIKNKKYPKKMTKYEYNIGINHLLAKKKGETIESYRKKGTGMGTQPANRTLPFLKKGFESLGGNDELLKDGIDDDRRARIIEVKQTIKQTEFNMKQEEKEIEDIGKIIKEIENKKEPKKEVKKEVKEVKKEVKRRSKKRKYKNGNKRT